MAIAVIVAISAISAIAAIVAITAVAAIAAIAAMAAMAVAHGTAMDTSHAIAVATHSVMAELLQGHDNYLAVQCRPHLAARTETRDREAGEMLLFRRKMGDR